jgi:hypothetical protein
LRLTFTGTGSRGPNNASGSCMLAPGTYGLIASQDNTVLKIATYGSSGVMPQDLLTAGANYYQGSSTGAVSTGSGTAGTFTLSSTITGTSAWTTQSGISTGLYIFAFE